MKRVLAALVSIVIMAVIFSRIDLAEFKVSLRGMNPWLFLGALFFFIPQILVTAYRWQVMVRSQVRIRMAEAVKLVLAANALNILLPSRLGDLSKAYFSGKGGNLDIKRGMSIVLFEKYMDLVALSLMMVLGLMGSRTEGLWVGTSLTVFLVLILFLPLLYGVRLEKWANLAFFEMPLFSKLRHLLLEAQAYLDELKGNRRLLTFIFGLSVGLWFLHVFQFYLVFLALHSRVSLPLVFHLVPLAIFVGLIPVTLAGIGSRDSALLVLFAPYEKASVIVAVGLLGSLRYLVPGILGIPFLNQFLVANPFRKK